METGLSTLGDRTFKVAAHRIWSILPKDIRKKDNYYTFKKQVKTYYFKLAYNLNNQDTSVIGLITYIC